MKEDIRLLVNERLGRPTRHEFKARVPAVGSTVNGFEVQGTSVIWRCLETGDLRRYGFERAEGEA